MILPYTSRIETFALEPDEKCGCYYCMNSGYPENGNTYVRGEAVLAEAGHPPYDGNANYICMGHLIGQDPDSHMKVVISDMANDGKEISREDYMALAPKGRKEQWWT